MSSLLKIRKKKKWLINLLIDFNDMSNRLELFYA